MHFTHAVCGLSHHAEGYIFLPTTFKMVNQVINLW